MFTSNHVSSERPPVNAPQPVAVPVDLVGDDDVGLSSAQVKLVAQLLGKASELNKRQKKKEGSEKSESGPTLDLTFAQLVCDPAGPFGQFCVENADQEGGVLVRRWNGDFWDAITDSELVTIAAQWLQIQHPEKATDQKAIGCMKFAQTLLRAHRPLPVTKVGRGEDVVLSLPGKYLRVAPSGEMRCTAPDPADGLTFGLTVDLPGARIGEVYLPGTLPEDSRFARMMRNALPADILTVVQQQCAGALVPESLSVAAWWTGKAGSGKSTLLECLCAVVSKPVTWSLDQLAKPFGLDSISRCSSIVGIHEVEGGKISDEGMLKSLISGNGVCVDRKNKTSITDHKNRAMFFICSNPEPFIKDKTAGVTRRLQVIPWENTLSGPRILNFHEVLLKEEGNVFLDWLLCGLICIMQRGRKLMEEDEWPASLRALKSTIKTNTDSVAAWVEDAKVKMTTTAGRMKDEAYDAYERFCLDTHREPLQRSQFWPQMRAGKFWDGNDTQQKPAAWAGALTIVGGKAARPRFVALDWTD
ncbi:DUF5906 domain-containing protein [Xanthomonas sp. NCPPB 2632]|uniref:DUF5906 domain-containing protein n=1 Tax=Xanthomonas sp. NCPPB 2632 TaxID=3240912 RepID=UPI0035133D42